MHKLFHLVITHYQSLLFYLILSKRISHFNYYFYKFYISYLYLLIKKVIDIYMLLWKDLLNNEFDVNLIIR